MIELKDFSCALNRNTFRSIIIKLRLMQQIWFSLQKGNAISYSIDWAN